MANLPSSLEFPKWTSSEARPLTGKPKLFENDYTWEMDEMGNHRIVDQGGIGGDWAGYASPAVSPNGEYVCFTAYFEGSLLPEHLIRMEPV